MSSGPCRGVPELLSAKSSPNVLKSSLKHRLKAPHEVTAPLRDHVGWIERKHVELVFLIDAQLVPSTGDVTGISGNAEVFDERAALKREICVPYFRLPGIHNSRRFFIDEGNAPAVEKVADLAFHAGFVLRPSACLVIAIVHPIGRER